MSNRLDYPRPRPPASLLIQFPLFRDCRRESFRSARAGTERKFRNRDEKTRASTADPIGDWDSLFLRGRMEQMYGRAVRGLRGRKLRESRARRALLSLHLQDVASLWSGVTRRV